MTPGDPRRFVSRGGEKLDGALDAFGIDVAGMRALDAGASTGGFTHCLLERGALSVVAVDVAYGQLAWTLRNDPRVVVLERTNVRALEPAAIGGPVDLTVADLAFISLRTVATALVSCTKDAGSLVLMVKPQFELARHEVPRGGVVADPELWREACRRVARAYGEQGCGLRAAVASGLTGPKGNREFFLHLLTGAPGGGDDALIDAAVRSAP